LPSQGQKGDTLTVILEGRSQFTTAAVHYGADANTGTGAIKPL
jgi:hypothetical protein